MSLVFKETRQLISWDDHALNTRLFNHSQSYEPTWWPITWHCQCKRWKAQSRHNTFEQTLTSSRVLTVFDKWHAFISGHSIFELWVTISIYVRATGPTDCKWLSHTHATQRNWINLQKGDCVQARLPCFRMPLRHIGVGATSGTVVTYPQEPGSLLLFVYVAFSLSGWWSVHMSVNLLVCLFAPDKQTSGWTDR